MDDLIRLLVIVVLIGGVAVFLADRLVGRVTVEEFQRGMRIERGRFVGLLDPGLHWFLKPTTRVEVIDGRPGAVAVDGQEVLTADGIAIKVSLVIRSVVGDPVARRASDQDPDRFVYLLAQLALRQVVAGRDLAAVLAEREAIGPAVAEIVAARMGEVGIELLSIDVRDIMVPAELRRAAAGVVAARQEGLIALERARGETAALRSLANAGRMLEDHPGLLSLRLVQELGAGSGNTVVLGVPDATPGLGGARPSRREADAP